MPKKVLIALPPEMLEKVDYIAQHEHRTRSDLIRESLRRYLDNFRKSEQNMPSFKTDTVENFTPDGAAKHGEVRVYQGDFR